jgi:hypothetical protein
MSRNLPQLLTQLLMSLTCSSVTRHGRPNLRSCFAKGRERSEKDYEYLYLVRGDLERLGIVAHDEPDSVFTS